MINIDKPILNGKTPDENLAIVERWIHKTADTLNVYLSGIEKEIRDGNKEDKPN